ncbi:MAG: glycosyltransferase [Rikenellaceae bacterium]
MKLELSLIIATYNRGEQLLRSLRSVVLQDADPATWELIVVNNNSDDDTVERVERFVAEHSSYNIRLLLEPQQGLSYARNCGIEAATAPIIAIIDDDEEVVTTFVSGYVDFFATHPAAAAAGGAVIPLYESERPRWMSRLCEVPIANPMADVDAPRRLPQGRIPAGGNMAIRSSIIYRYGSFDPELGRKGDKLLGGEESNLFDRLYRAGEEVWFVGGVAIFHIIPDTKLHLDYLRRLWFNIGVSQMRRSKIENVSVATIFFREGAKWIATIVLAFFALLCLNPQKGRYLLKMRCNITRGLFSAR